MLRGTIYLSGPITGCYYDNVVSWRDRAVALFGPEYRVLSPMRGKEFLDSGTLIQDSYRQPDHPLSTQKGIMTRDYNDSTRCDVMLVYLCEQQDRVSVGTVIEIAWAFAHRKPVVAVMGPGANIHDHAMVREAIAYNVRSLEEAVALCKLIIG